MKAVGLASVGILQDNEWDSGVTVEGHLRASQENTQAYMNSIGPGYFTALGVPVVAGRDFTVQDTAQVKHGSDDDDFTPRVVIVNEKFARRFFGEANPLGRHVGFGTDPGTPTDMEIVGVIKDIKYTTLRDEIPIQMFIPYLASRFVGDMTVYVRTTLPPETLVSLARDRVRKLDPHLPLYGVRTMDQRVTDSLLIERLIAGLSAAFGLLATLLASVGWPWARSGGTSSGWSCARPCSWWESASWSVFPRPWPWRATREASFSGCTSPTPSPSASRS